MRKHWTEVMSCQCGKRFWSMSAEAFHRHNFPVLCRRKPEPKPKKVKPNEAEGAQAGRRRVQDLAGA